MDPKQLPGDPHPETWGLMLLTGHATSRMCQRQEIPPYLGEGPLRPAWSAWSPVPGERSQWALLRGPRKKGYEDQGGTETSLRCRSHKNPLTALKNKREQKLVTVKELQVPENLELL